MDNLPHLMNWESALIATSIAIPALLILYFLKLRRQERVVASTLLWRKAIQDLQVNAPFQKLRRNLLLFLQLLILLALLLALSRPVTSYRPPPGEVSVILIDRSASMSARDMDGHTRLEEAKRRAVELVDSMPKNASAMVVAFDNSAETVQSFTSDQVALRNAINAIKPTDRPTKLSLAYELADASMNFNPDQLRSNSVQPDVYLYSDGRAQDATDVGLKGKLHFQRVGTDSAENVGIVALSAKRNYEKPTQVQVFARLANYGTEPREVPVRLSIDGETVDIGGEQTQRAFLLPDRWAKDEREKWEASNSQRQSDTVTFNLEITSAATVKLEIERGKNDVLAADDSAAIIVPSPKQLEVLLVTEGNYFLERAISNMRLKSPKVITPASYEEKKPDKYDVVIFDRCTPKYLPEAGNYVYCGAVPPVAQGPGQKITAATTPNGDPIFFNGEEVLDWQRDNPMLKDLAMDRLYISRSMKLNVPADARTLVDGLKGPLVVLARDGKRTNLIIGFDILESNWPFEVSFPIFLHRALQFMAVGSDMDVRQSFEPGASPVIPRANLQRAAAGLKSLKLKGPMGERNLTIPASGDFVLPPLEKVGIYTTDPPVPQFEKIAVNLLDSNESNTLPSSLAPGEAGAKIENVKDQKARREWWWYLVAFVGLPMLMIEWWVYTRRVHL